MIARPAPVRARPGGARTRPRRRPPLLSLSPPTTPDTLVPGRVGDKTNAIPVAQELLPPLALRGRVVTAEAVPTPTALAPLSLDQGGPYLFTVKDNPPRLHAALAAYCAAPQATGRTAHTVDRRRGRTETRTLSARTRLNAYGPAYCPFPQIAQGARLIRTVDTTGQTTTETVYLITALTPRQATPQRLLTRSRGPWRGASRPWMRAVTVGEERAPLRTRAAPQIMAAWRNLVVPRIRRTGTTALAALRQHRRSRPATARRLLVPKKRSA